MIRTWLASAAIVGALAAPGVANATINDLTISGSLDGHSYTGTLSLDVTGGQATSGTGTLSILGLTNAPLVASLIPKRGCTYFKSVYRFGMRGGCTKKAVNRR